MFLQDGLYSQCPNVEFCAIDPILLFEVNFYIVHRSIVSFSSSNFLLGFEPCYAQLVQIGRLVACASNAALVDCATLAACCNCARCASNNACGILDVLACAELAAASGWYKEQRLAPWTQLLP